MSDSAFEELERALQSGGAEAAFHLLVRRFREQKNHAALFETRMMKKRHELGLPLVHLDSLEDIPEPLRRTYEEAFIAAAREAGGLFLADGDVPRAWSYFRAIGEPAPVADAIEQLDPAKSSDRIIEIAFHERVNPRKGFELILGSYGICRAISFFDQYPARQGREESLALLARTLHVELVDNLKRVIARREGETPDSQRIPELIANRDWLFEADSYYIDTSHVISILRFCLEAQDGETLRLGAELADYGVHLSPMYHYRGEPPFENVFEDHGIYLRALLGQDVEAAITHFRQKVAQNDLQETGAGSAQVLVALLVRLGRYSEAVDVSLEHLQDADSVLQLCEMAGQPDRLMQLARERDNLLGFTAGALQKPT